MAVLGDINFSFLVDCRAQGLLDHCGHRDGGLWAERQKVGWNVKVRTVQLAERAGGTLAGSVEPRPVTLLWFTSQRALALLCAARGEGASLVVQLLMKRLLWK